MNTPVVDAHVHIFPPAMIDRRDTLLTADWWFRETYGHPAAKMRTADELVARMDAAGVDISVVCGWPWASGEHCAEHNTYLAEVARTHPDRIVWLGIVNPIAAGACEEIARCVHLGARGFGELNANGQGFSWEHLDEISDALNAISQSGLPLMCHTSEPMGHKYPGKGNAWPQRVLEAIGAFPELNWVLAHWGGGLPFYELMPEIKATCARVSYDSAATSFLYDVSVFRRVIDLVGADKVLFGSDWPVLGQAKLIESVRRAGLTQMEHERVLGLNAMRVYGIS